MPKQHTEPKRRAAAKASRAVNDRKPRAERWQELLEAAAEIFHEKGYDATSLQDIARRVGILKGSIYYYIETKADLRNSLLLQVHQEGLAAVRDAAAVEGNALDKLDAMIRGHIDYICRHLAKTTVYLQELRKLSVEERTNLLGRQNYRDAFLEIIKAGQEEGSILPSLDAQLTARAMLGSLNSIYQWHRPTGSQRNAELADYFVTTILRGHATAEALAAYRQRTSQTVGW